MGKEKSQLRSIMNKENSVESSFGLLKYLCFCVFHSFVLKRLKTVFA